MKKSIILIFLLILICAAVFTACQSNLAMLNKECNYAVTGKSKGSFTAKCGDEILIRYNSKVESGNLIIEITNNKGKIIRVFKTNIKGSDKITVKETGKYVLDAAYSKFKGKISVNVQRK
ncbi:hypothetical protein BJV85_003167 [Clostridium acetobutylicum]|uniref:Lipoprotein n=1 Tax=Clostridium acetobutylicum (strain ATCC 824 / DSM 792 / JCM 1419 / IAM 19013 / LMG 5710 / NBRC 13948 / NRRL B-527 / VKM B-1787 / 2291 / W) TaxID=272562 RepID=Q97KS4_CLOAB|nr:MULTISPECIES: hypothetical protein [Clostridium]AAK78818.1 Hypothetical protein, CF-28 family [Clostridium acetobutylicum ATCC 824]ADZ19892.1 conserved hypothetical protein [Clostridium acetobutylicum EA 2018]AEI31467.1 hypothetical protein SMB_G0858 [Clostridium acetobutylicum DSM 1731]AWV80536.1 hypothetical protein DK921_10605 [Clostridium acetobutylicum]MBC2392726.1 hypothetical protein [Clostridium acetobutylicum]